MEIDYNQSPFGLPSHFDRANDVNLILSQSYEFQKQLKFESRGKGPPSFRVLQVAHWRGRAKNQYDAPVRVFFKQFEFEEEGER